MWKNIVLSQDDNEINNVLLTLKKKTLVVAKSAMVSTKSVGRRHGPKDTNCVIHDNDYDIIKQNWKIS